MTLFVFVLLTFVTTTINAALTLYSLRYRIRTDREHMTAHEHHAEVHDGEVAVMEQLHAAAHVHVQSTQGVMRS